MICRRIFIRRKTKTFSTMRIVAHPFELGSKHRVALALGTFDGLHCGHQAVLRTLRQTAAEEDTECAVLFFSPLPREVLNPASPPRRLLSDAEKLALFPRYGIDTAVQVPFDRALASLTPDEFLRDYLFSDALPLSAVCVGEQWRFGRDNSGDTDTLRRAAAARSVRVITVPPVLECGLPVSSTRIREAVAAGEFDKVQRLLGRPYLICGQVATGNGIAHDRLQCPTANLDDPHKQLPPYGVYAACTTLRDSGDTIPGIVYIGNAPTFRHDGHPIVEVHLFGFTGDLYGRNIAVQPVKFLRESRRFDSPEALKAQISRDIASAQHALAAATPQ